MPAFPGSARIGAAAARRALHDALEPADRRVEQHAGVALRLRLLRRDHLEAALHGAAGLRKGRAARVLEGLPRLERRRLTHHARAALGHRRVQRAVRVADLPLAADGNQPADLG